MFPFIISTRSANHSETNERGFVFLISDESDYNLSLKISRSYGLDNATILTLSSSAPYLTDDLIHLPQVTSWQDVGIGDLSISRYWLDNYREIDAAVISIINENPSLKNHLTLSEFFRLDLVLALGQNFLEPIAGLNTMLLTLRPNMLFIPSRRSLIKNAAISLATHHKIVCRELC